MNEHLEAVPGLKQELSPGELAVLLEIYRQTDSLGKAKRVLLEFLLNSPNEHTTFILLATLFHELGEPANAYRTWRSLVQREKANPVYFLQLGASAQQCGLYEQAVEAFEWYLLLKPDDAWGLYQAAYALFELGENYKAIAKLKKVSGIPEASFLGALCLRRLGDYADALEWMKRAEFEGKERSRNRNRSREKNSSETEKDERDFLSKSFYLTYAFIAEKAGAIDEVERVLTQLLSVQPDDPEILNFLGYVFADHNLHLDRAEEMIRKADEADPGNSAYLDSLAWIHYRKGEYRKAADAILRSLAADENPDPVILDHAGDIFLALGEVEKALQYWREAAMWYSADLDPAKLEEKIRRHAAP
jgi:tetratricopeptide (TPR) repeat protein